MSAVVLLPLPAWTGVVMVTEPAATPYALRWRDTPAKAIAPSTVLPFEENGSAVNGTSSTAGRDGHRDETPPPVSYTHLRAHETPEHLVCRLLLEKKKKKSLS